MSDDLEEFLVFVARHVFRLGEKHDFSISPTEPPLDLAVVVLIQEHIHNTEEKTKTRNSYLCQKILR